MVIDYKLNLLFCILEIDLIVIDKKIFSRTGNERIVSDYVNEIRGNPNFIQRGKDELPKIRKDY